MGSGFVVTAKGLGLDCSSAAMLACNGTGMNGLKSDVLPFHPEARDKEDGGVCWDPSPMDEQANRSLSHSSRPTVCILVMAPAVACHSAREESGSPV